MENAEYYEMTWSHFCSPRNFVRAINFKSTRKVTHVNTQRELESRTKFWSGNIRRRADPSGREV
jgi:hypothetical protein